MKCPSCGYDRYFSIEREDYHQYRCAGCGFSEMNHTLIQRQQRIIESRERCLREIKKITAPPNLMSYEKAVYELARKELEGSDG